MEETGREIEPMQGDVYGDISEEAEFRAIENPYYEDGSDTQPPNTCDENPNIDQNATEVVTMTQNFYYEM